MWAKAILPAVLGAVILGGCGAAPGGLSAGRTLSKNRAESEFDEAVALVGELKYQQALARFERLEPAFLTAGETAKAAECIFWRGYCLEKLSRNDQAAGAYRIVIEQYSAAPGARQAARRLAWLEARRGGGK